ncbi:MAG: hypothetical protein BWY65_01813 [Firmicutes bacterium ADurb.Bin373]|nr:MAG: hypothetical protein BWY65_01813 [Firmicutes bacterium ADurb.Bin373]
MPTLTVSTPALIRSLVPSAVATLPAITTTSGYCSFILVTSSITLLECPCAVSTTRASTLALTSAFTLAIVSDVTPTAAATIKRPLLSFAALGYWRVFSISFIVISPRSINLSSTIGSFSILYFFRISFAWSTVVPCGAVTRFSFVITSSTFLVKSRSKRRSRLVRIPTSFPFTVIGTPDIRYLSINTRASLTRLSGERKIGSDMMPCSERLTRSTSSDWRSIGIFLWITPIPPSRAIAIAILDSVTVSMPALISGIFSFSPLARFVTVSTSLGRTSAAAGMSITSSKVRPSLLNLSGHICSFPPCNNVNKQFCIFVYYSIVIAGNVQAILSWRWL